MSNNIDLAIITALPVERNAVLSRLDVYELEPNKTYYTGKIESYNIMVSLLPEMGNIPSTKVATQLIERLNPTNVIMLGIAAGVPNKVKLGDVVVANFCHYYELAKLEAGHKEQRRTRQYRSSRQLYNNARNYQVNDWDIKVVAPIQQESPQVHFGPIASGDKVIADEYTLKCLINECPELLAAPGWQPPLKITQEHILLKYVGFLILLILIKMMIGRNMPLIRQFLFGCRGTRGPINHSPR